ncbi:hypothetical protein EDB85DRAFT_2028567, partial [Lactarius pseudohatsudake]
TSKHFMSLSDEIAEESSLRASCHNQPPPNTVPLLTMEAGRLPEEIYTSTLPSWRAAVRRQCLAVVERESEIIAQWQSRVLDTYFLHMSMLAPHTYLLSRVSPCVFLLRTRRP